MEPIEHETTKDEFSESVVMLLRGLPPPIREFIQGPRKDAFLLTTVQKYNLHADQAGVLEKSLLFMLLGVYNPEEFVEELKEANVAEETITALTNEVNEQVFKPLREQEQQTTAPTANPISNPSSTPVVTPKQILTESSVLGTPAIKKNINRLETVASVPIPQKPTPPPAPAPIAPPAQPVSPPVPKPKPTNAPERTNREGQPQIRTMAADIEAVKEHRKPSAFFAHGAPPIPVPPRLPVVPTGPGVRTTPPSIPASNPVVAADEKAHAATQPSVSSVETVPSTRSAPPPPNLPGAPLIKEYGNDPYREPME